MGYPQAIDAPATAVVPFRGKTLFEKLDDPRIALDPEGRDADFIVVPYPHSVAGAETQGSLAQMLAGALSPDELQRAAAGLATLVFDASAEGDPHRASWTDWAHAGFADLGVSPSGVVLVTQERNYADDYGAHAETRGWTDRMEVAFYDLWIKRFHAQFEGNGERRFRQRRRAFEARAAGRSRRFISLNLTARAMKVLFLLRVLKDGLWDAGYISFGGFDRRINEFEPEANVVRRGATDFLQEKLGSPAGFQDMVAELRPWLEALEAKGRTFLGEVSQDETGRVNKTPVKDGKLEAYDDSWFTVVTETEMRDRPSRITEKPFRALANFHPLIVLGNPGSLRMIREFGYRTFSGAIDESYDEEPDPRRRFDMVYAEFLRLCRLDDADLARFEAGLHETLAHNARWALVEMPRIYREQRDTALVDLLLAVRERSRTRGARAG